MILSDRALHLNLDDAWPNDWMGLPVADARSWGPRLRFSAPPRLIEPFYRERGRDLAVPSLLYGSGNETRVLVEQAFARIIPFSSLEFALSIGKFTLFLGGD